MPTLPADVSPSPTAASSAPPRADVSRRAAYARGSVAARNRRSADGAYAVAGAATSSDGDHADGVWDTVATRHKNNRAR